jgi:hypothetical protein
MPNRSPAPAGEGEGEYHRPRRDARRNPGSTPRRSPVRAGGGGAPLTAIATLARAGPDARHVMDATVVFPCSSHARARAKGEGAPRAKGERDRGERRERERERERERGEAPRDQPRGDIQSERGEARPVPSVEPTRAGGAIPWRTRARQARPRKRTARAASRNASYAAAPPPSPAPPIPKSQDRHPPPVGQPPTAALPGRRAHARPPARSPARGAEGAPAVATRRRGSRKKARPSSGHAGRARAWRRRNRSIGSSTTRASSRRLGPSSSGRAER